MRTIKLLSLAALSAFALVAFAGVGTASATTLCRVNTRPCPAGSVIAVPTTITASLATGTNAVLTTAGGAANPTITCTTSTATVTADDTVINARLTALTFRGCTSVNPTGCSSTGSVTGLPTTGTLTAIGGGNGTLTLTAPNVTFTCTILGLPVPCTFGDNTITGTFTGGAPAMVRFTNVAVDANGSFGCPSSSRWTATYRIDSPSPLFVV